MKVLKDNYGKIDDEYIKSYPRELECEKCESILEYEESDLKEGVYGAMHVKCPLCGHNNMIDGNEHDVTVTKDNIKFPLHFHHTSKETGAVEVSTEEIKKRIQKGIDYFRENKDEFYWFTESGDTYVGVSRYDGDEEYNIVVTKNYYETYIPFEPVDYK